MMNLLEGKYLWDIVEYGYKDPVDWSVLSEEKKKETKGKKKKKNFWLCHISRMLLIRAFFQEFQPIELLLMHGKP